MITTGHVTNQMAMPVCRYEILSTTAAGLPVKYAKVGEMVYHRWICDAQDELSNKIVELATRLPEKNNQCSIDKYVLQDLDYSADLMAGREAHVFKFADKSTLYFNCQLEIAIKTAENPNCNATRPKCDRNMTIPQATSSSDTTTVSTNTISSENSMSAKAETTSNTVTMQPNTFNIVNLTSRISSNLPNDTIPVVVPDIFHNGTFTNFSVPFRSSMLDGTTETPNDSTNGIDRKRRDDLLMARDYPEKLGDFDLPRQQLLVLDIDDDKDHASSKNDPQSSDADSYQPSGFLPTKCDASTVNNNNNKLCLSVVVFYTFFLSLVLISLICIFFTIKACLVRRKLQRIYFLRTNNRKNVCSSSTTTSNGCGSSHADDSSLSMAS
uniref:ZP domain-containing protein n=1 Tax=Romanomermis culicivorax TaxID=13658 RepID=A0A915JWM9_ROMCU